MNNILHSPSLLTGCIGKGKFTVLQTKHWIETISCQTWLIIVIITSAKYCIVECKGPGCSYLTVSFCYEAAYIIFLALKTLCIVICIVLASNEYSILYILGRVRSSCMLVLHLCSVMVASQHIVDTRQNSTLTVHVFIQYCMTIKLIVNFPSLIQVAYCMGTLSIKGPHVLQWAHAVNSDWRPH